MQHAERPKVEPQLAVVTDNHDPEGLGRVRVKFLWQDGDVFTPFIRILRPDFGSGEQGGSNRGYFWIPEIGDQVLVQFFEGMPEQPYVAGALGHGKNKASGHLVKNHLKSISTRTGHTIEFNDADGGTSITVKDNAGNEIFLDTQGRNITITAPETMTLNAENMVLNVGKTMSVNVGEQMQMHIVEKLLVNTAFMQQITEGLMHLQSGQALINSENNIKIEAEEVYAAGMKKMFVHSDETLVVNSKGTAEMKGEAGNKLLNQAQTYKATTPEIDAKCIAHFRPLDSWDGSGYGFDFMRIDDTGMTADTSGNMYEKIVGRKSTSFPDASVFTKLKTEYKPHNILSRPKKDSSGNVLKDASGNTIYEEYYVPLLCLFPKEIETVDNTVTLANKKGKPQKIWTAASYSNTEANLMLYLHVEEEPEKIELKYKTDLIKVDKATLTPKTKTTGTPHKISIKIECLREFDKEQDIEVFATVKKTDGTTEEKLSGKLRLLANKQRYKTKIAIVQVSTNISGKSKTGNPLGREDELRKYLRQGLVEPEFETLQLDFTSDTDSTGNVTNAMTNFNTAHASGGIIPNGATDAIQNDLNNALYAKYDALKKDYRNHYKIYFIDESARMGTPRSNLYGRAFGIPSAARSVVVFAVGFTDSTLAHETLHAMGLYHSFDDSGKYTFKQDLTDNIMDYSDVASSPIPVIQLWNWQWEKIWGNTEKE